MTWHISIHYLAFAVMEPQFLRSEFRNSVEHFCQELDIRVAGRECKEVLEEDQDLVKKIALQLQHVLKYLDVQEAVRFWL